LIGQIDLYSFDLLSYNQLNIYSIDLLFYFFYLFILIQKIKVSFKKGKIKYKIKK